MKVPTLAAASAVLLAGQSEARMGWGACPPRPPAKKGFEIERYTGLWYEIKRDKEVWYEQDQDCVTAYYTSRKNDWFYQLGVNNGSVRRSTGKLSNGYLFGTPGSDITVSQARCN